MRTQTTPARVETRLARGSQPRVLAAAALHRLIILAGERAQAGTEALGRRSDLATSRKEHGTS